MQRRLLAALIILLTLATLTACSDPTPAREIVTPTTAPTPTAAPASTAPVTTEGPTERPTAAPTPTLASPPALEPTATPAPPGVLAPLQALDISALLSEQCPPTNWRVSAMTQGNWSGRLPGPARHPGKNRPSYIGCLEDETVARIFLAGFVPGPGAAQPRNVRLRPGSVRSHRPQGGHDRKYRGRPGEDHGREHDGALCNDGVPER